MAHPADASTEVVSAIQTLTKRGARPDPYPLYRQIREENPFIRLSPKAWVVSGHTETALILKSRSIGRLMEMGSDGAQSPPNGSAKRSGASFFLQKRFQQRAQPFFQMARKWMLFLNPPDHTRLRTLATEPFSPRSVETVRPRIREIAEELLDPIQGEGRLELMSQLAQPFPVLVICEMLGVPPKDHARFKQLSRALAGTLDMQGGNSIRDLWWTWRQLGKGSKATSSFLNYFERLVADRRGDPKDDLISALVSVEEEGDRLKSEELIATLILLFLAGHITTTDLVGNGVLALLKNREQWDALRSAPAIAPTAVEELLRFDSPVQATGRSVLEDCEIAGRSLHRGDVVTLMLAAANRDPSAFSEPDRLDLVRLNNRHIAFAAGIHFCLGAALARVEAQEALTLLAERMPDLRVEGEPSWREGVVLRGMNKLPLAF